MTLRLFGAGAIALAMLAVTLTTWPAYAKQCGKLDRSRGVIVKVDCPSEGRAVKRDRRHFRGREAQREARRLHLRSGADRQRGVGSEALRETWDNDGRRVAAADLAPVRLARGGATAHAGEAVAAQILPHPAGCPRRAFCGCGAAVRVFGAPIRSLWLARAWFKFPPAAPAPGMVAVRRHHVYVIEAVVSPGRVIAYDANSGRGLTRRHVRSLAGFSVRDPRASS
jgi:hypothetical protein